MCATLGWKERENKACYFIAAKTMMQYWHTNKQSPLQTSRIVLISKERKEDEKKLDIKDEQYENTSRVSADMISPGTCDSVGPLSARDRPEIRQNVS